MTMQKLEGHQTYDQVHTRLKSLNIAPRFDTPGRHDVVIIGMQTQSADISNIDKSDEHTAEADCTIFLVAPDTLPQADQYPVLSDALSRAKKLIVLVNKMCRLFPKNDSFSVNQVGMHLTGLKSNSEQPPST